MLATDKVGNGNDIRWRNTGQRQKHVCNRRADYESLSRLLVVFAASEVAPLEEHLVIVHTMRERQRGTLLALRFPAVFVASTIFHLFRLCRL